MASAEHPSCPVRATPASPDFCRVKAGVQHDGIARHRGRPAALRELGRLERTLFTLDWITDPELRRTTGQELNKGESRNSLARAVFIHRLGEIRDRTY